MSSKQRGKRKFNVVFVHIVKKSALHVQSLLFFIYLLGLFRSDALITVAFVVTPRIYRCAQMVRNSDTFSVKPPAISVPSFH